MAETYRRHLLMRLLKVLCDAQEFAEVPVRHNEELLNEELAETLGVWSAASGFRDYLGSLESSHTKALLLILAALARAKLPITDYLNDTKTVMEQVPRVLNAMIDVAADDDQFYAALALMQLAQLIASRTPFLTAQRGAPSGPSVGEREGRYRVAAVKHRDFVDNGAGQNRATTAADVVSLAPAVDAVLPLRKGSEQELTLVLASSGKGEPQRPRRRNGGGRAERDEGSWWVVLSAVPVAVSTPPRPAAPGKSVETVATGGEANAAAPATPHVLAMKRAGDFAAAIYRDGRRRAAAGAEGDAASRSTASSRTTEGVAEGIAEVTVVVHTPETTGRYRLSVDLISDATFATGDTRQFVTVDVY